MQAVSRQFQSDSAVECPRCGTAQCSPVLEFNNVPIIPNTAWTTAKAALAAPLASVCLVSCSRCQLIYNAAFANGSDHLYRELRERSALLREIPSLFPGNRSALGDAVQAEE